MALQMGGHRMKVLVDVTGFATTRRADGPGVKTNSLTIRQVGDRDDNGNFEAEVAGPRVKVMQWLKRHKYDEGSYEIVTN
jgi:hypothetical protein